MATSHQLSLSCQITLPVRVFSFLLIIPLIRKTKNDN
ncbi:hypothetical protein PSPHG_CDS_0198 [Pseudomonas phage Psxphi15]